MPIPAGPQVPVGPFFYCVQLTDEPIILDGRRCDALYDPCTMRFLIDAALQPVRRINRFWHEYGHACKGDLDITEARSLGEESICNLVALGLTRMSPRLLACIHMYLTEGITAHDVMILPGIHRPIPIIRFSACEPPTLSPPS